MRGTKRTFPFRGFSLPGAIPRLPSHPSPAGVRLPIHTMDESIRQPLEDLDAAYNTASAQLRSLAEKRRHLEERRQRILLQLEEPGDHSPELHHTLADLDRELDRAREEEHAYLQQAKVRVESLRSLIQSTLGDRRQSLTEQLREAQTEADHLRDELIPEARRYLDDLMERHRAAHARSLTLANQLAASTNEVPDLSRYDLAE